MREALVEHPQHDVDRDQRRDDQDRLRADRRPVCARVAGIFGVQAVRQMQCGDRLVDAPRRLGDRHVLVQAKADGDRGKLPLMIDDQGG